LGCAAFGAGEVASAVVEGVGAVGAELPVVSRGAAEDACGVELLVQKHGVGGDENKPGEGAADPGVGGLGFEIEEIGDELRGGNDGYQNEGEQPDVAGDMDWARDQAVGVAAAVCVVEPVPAGWGSGGGHGEGRLGGGDEKSAESGQQLTANSQQPTANSQQPPHPARWATLSRSSGRGGKQPTANSQQSSSQQPTPHGVWCHPTAEQPPSSGTLCHLLPRQREKGMAANSQQPTANSQQPTANS
jgi:hypothetical protein